MTIHRTWHTLMSLTIWNFNSLFRVCLIFYTLADSANFKSIGNNTMKKMLLATVCWPCFTQMLNRRLLFKQTGSSSTSVKPSPIISFCFELGRRNPSMSQICGGAENVVKTETQQTFVKWIVWFYYFRAFYTPLEARVYCSHCMSCPSIWATLSKIAH